MRIGPENSGDKIVKPEYGIVLHIHRRWWFVSHSCIQRTEHKSMRTDPNSLCCISIQLCTNENSINDQIDGIKIEQVHIWTIGTLKHESRTNAFIRSTHNTCPFSQECRKVESTKLRCNYFWNGIFAYVWTCSKTMLGMVIMFHIHGKCFVSVIYNTNKRYFGAFTFWPGKH